MGRKAIDYTGKKYGMLTGLKNTGQKFHKGFVWEWLCDCGNTHQALPQHVTSGSTKSCGCYRKEKSVIKAGETYGYLTAIKKTEEKYFNSYKWLFVCVCGKFLSLSPSHVMGDQKSCGCMQHSNPHKTHGMTSSPEYRSWQEMKARCGGKDDVSIKHYAGRGIDFCETWNSFDRFYEDMGPRPAGTSLERIDNDLGYSAANCRWATQSEQMANTRRTIRVFVDGVEYCLKHACALRGINYDKVRSRIRKGMQAQEALDMG
ncbi:TPA: hypothetical protein N3N81_004816 [Klebsiella variicola subsp. variicola]|nr:hypothetical protein [Klebsiella variicola subsp. variicola]HCM5370450.1 hypothetical protein [Klebsiella variicola subsp. variicola]